MKHLILLIILFLVCLTTSGQQINQPTNLYRGGDILEKKQVIVKGFSLNGSNGVWSVRMLIFQRRHIRPNTPPRTTQS